MTDELTFLRELEQVVQRAHAMLVSHRYAFVHDTDPTEHSLLAKKLINDRIIELLEYRNEHIGPSPCSRVLAQMLGQPSDSYCTMPKGHNGSCGETYSLQRLS